MRNIIIFFLLCFTTQLFAQEIGFTPNMLYKSGIKVDTVFIQHDSIYCPPKVYTKKAFVPPVPCTFTSIPIVAEKDTVLPMSIEQIVNVNMTTNTVEPTLIIVKDKEIRGIGKILTGTGSLVLSVICFAEASSYNVHIAEVQSSNKVYLNRSLIVDQTTGTSNRDQEMQELLHHKEEWQTAGCVTGGIGIGLITWGTIQLYRSAGTIGVRINF
jgi:hypothetical protein